MAETAPIVPTPRPCEHPGCSDPCGQRTVRETVVDGGERTEVWRHYCVRHYAAAVTAKEARA